MPPKLLAPSALGRLLQPLVNTLPTEPTATRNFTASGRDHDTRAGRGRKHAELVRLAEQRARRYSSLNLPTFDTFSDIEYIGFMSGLRKINLGKQLDRHSVDLAVKQYFANTFGETQTEEFAKGHCPEFGVGGLETWSRLRKEADTYWSKRTDG